MYVHHFITVEKNGDVCISILHEPGEDKWGYEKPEERWLPIHTVETILISVISMLADPNDESPANVDAAVSYLKYNRTSVCIQQNWHVLKMILELGSNGTLDASKYGCLYNPHT